MFEGIYISTNAFVDRRPESILRSLATLPPVGVELSALDADKATCIAFAHQLHSSGFPIALHNYFPVPDRPFVLNLAACDVKHRRFCIDFCRRSLDLSAEVGAPHYAVHPGFAVDFHAADLGNPDRQAKFAREGVIAPFEVLGLRAVESLLELAEHGRSVGVTLLVENNVISPRSGPDGSRMIPMAHPQELKLLTDAGIPLLFDFAHAKVSATTYGESAADWFRELRPHIAAFHLSDNDGEEDTGEGFEEDAWFAAAVKSEPSLSATLELNRQTDAEIRLLLERIAIWRS